MIFFKKTLKSQKLAYLLLFCMQQEFRLIFPKKIMM